MNDTVLGELEELVLLTIASLTGNAYSIAICDALQKSTGRTMKLSAVHPVLSFLEAKGLVSSSLGEATSLRGGNRKRYYALIPATEVRDQLWNRIHTI